MRKSVRILFLFCALLCVAAEDLICSVSQTSDLTTYTVSAPKGTKVSAPKGTNCCYSWSNGSHHVLANEADKLEHLVVNKDWASLTTRKCFEKVHYTLDCTSDDTVKNTSCTVDCRGNVGDGGSRSYLTAITVVSVLVVTILIIIIIIIISLRKKKHQLKALNLSEEEEQEEEDDEESA